MQDICSSNPPVFPGICDRNKSRAQHHRSLKLDSKLKYLKKCLVSGRFYYKPTSFWINKKVQNFLIWCFNLDWYQQQIKNKIIITKDTISAIDHITNSIINNEFKTADISDHLPIIYAFKLKMKLISLKLSVYINILLKGTLMQIWKFFNMFVFV